MSDNKICNVGKKSGWEKLKEAMDKIGSHCRVFEESDSIFNLKKSITFALSLLLIAAPAVVHAATANFSWLPNQDGITTSYEIRCSTRSVAELDGDKHELWKTVSMDNVVDGRVQYTWTDFPENEQYFCVCVAKGISAGKIVTSDYSNELDVLLQVEPQIPGVPAGLQVDVTVSVSVN